MSPATAPHPAPTTCATGDWAQKFSCGWHQPTTGAANAGTFTGHNIAPWVIALIIGVVIIALIRRSRVGSPATSS